MSNKRKVPIVYTNRDFNSIKAALLEYAKRYYPNTYKDFNEASFGSLMLDSVAYTGDILSFYVDYQANESFLNTALEYDNIIKHGRALGYKFRGRPASSGIAIVYVIVPANTTGLGPNTAYIPILLKGSTFSSTSGNGFILNEDIDFSNSNNEVVVASVNDTTGLPVSYAIRAYGEVISGEIVEETIEIGNFEKFLRIPLSAPNLTEVMSVVDSEGHEYFEVEYLSQNVIYKSITNRGSDRDKAAAILKPVVVPRRFVVEQLENRAYLQFGYGSQEEIKTVSIADPSNVVLRLHGKDYVTDESFDPSNLIATDKFGVAPSNTTLTIISRTNTSTNVNIAANTLNQIVGPIFEFNNITSLNQSLVNDVVSSLEVNNEEPIVGDVSLPSSEELKRRIFDVYASQNRAVTRSDYVSLIYQMPPRFGAIKRAAIYQDNDSFKRNLNLYVISENEDGTLTSTVDIIKENLKIWLSSGKMINDTVDIMDAKIVNVGIEYEIVVDDEEERFSILNNTVERLKEEFQYHFDIGESFNISNIYTVLNSVDGVVDTTSVKIVPKVGGLYSDYTIDIDEYMSADGRVINIPKNAIFEIKYTNIDIVGALK